MISYNLTDLYWLFGFLGALVLGYINITLGFILMTFAVIATMLVVGILRYKIKELESEVNKNDKRV